MNILAIIPARGGSKGISNKNIRKLAGKPLIEYSITSAKKSKKINRIIVTTDNKKIASISKKAGAEIPFLRPKQISKDDTPIIDVIQHTLDFLENTESYKPEIIILLQPTNPLRSIRNIDNCINLLLNSKSSSVISVSLAKHHPDISFTIQNNFLKPLNSKFEKHSLRQKRKLIYSPSGLIYGFWYDTLKKYHSIYGPKIKPLITKNNAELIDIDEPFDLFLAEMILKHWKHFLKNF